MKEFREPEVDVIEYSDNDAIVTSGCSSADKENMGFNCGGNVKVTCLDGKATW